MTATATAAPADEPEESGGRKRTRANGEGSIFPYKGKWAAVVWVTTPTGERRRKWVYGRTREETHDKYVHALAAAKNGPVPTTTPNVAQYLTRWLEESIKPNREPTTWRYYDLMARAYVTPGLGKKRLAKLTVRDVQTWLNGLPGKCQCCAQKKDEQRLAERRRCCAAGDCCEDYASRNTIRAARDTLRAALTHAMAEELITRNVAMLVKLPTARKRTRKGESWTVEEARRFLVFSRDWNDDLYALWVLILVLGLRKGEALGLRWTDVDFDEGALNVAWQLQRVGAGPLLHKERTKTDGSTDTLPLPEVVTAALRMRQRQQDQARRIAGKGWRKSDLVFTTRTGGPIEPSNVNRAFTARSLRAKVKRIRVHDTRHTCGSLLVALDVHPRVAMQILRHSKISITMEIYSEVPPEETRKALKQLGDFLEKPAD
ncbi:site-specific integrase [Actinocorallia longicatena]|uniref:Site-specific integrase n=1 Tax=Actinocorallia longicatena TaxID=111803 RepID=A0ABP6QGM7_9ACTN